MIKWAVSIERRFGKVIKAIESIENSYKFSRNHREINWQRKINWLAILSKNIKQRVAFSYHGN